MSVPKDNCSNIRQHRHALCIYAASQTYTATVFESLDSLRKYSAFEWSFINYTSITSGDVDFNYYDAVVIHYSVRLPFDQLGETIQKYIREFLGIKVLFIQDEYDHTNKSKQIIQSCRFNLVFTVVPRDSIEKIYPSNEFHQTKFVNNLTGYVPDELISQVGRLTPPSKRSLFIAYRGRPLPIRYGRLGQEKFAIGQHVKTYCHKHGISCDIEWDESSRIYGKHWYVFISSAKAMLGSESGSNVFDWDGDLQQTIDHFRKKWPNATESDIYKKIIEEREVDGLMNQISPRVFEMAAAKTVMVLFEGSYSGVLKPGTHFFPLKKDFSNLDQILAELRDDIKVDAMADRAYQDIILSGKYSYRQFVGMVDSEIETLFGMLKRPRTGVVTPSLSEATEYPVRAKSPLPVLTSPLAKALGRLLIALWQQIPIGVRPYLKRLLGRA
jgi:hypothetical protein